jgi:hypothetical protein
MVVAHNLKTLGISQDVLIWTEEKYHFPTHIVLAGIASDCGPSPGNLNIARFLL